VKYVLSIVVTIMCLFVLLVNQLYAAITVDHK